MSRSELGDLVRALKDQLEWQSGGFASKVRIEGASELERETFNAAVRQRRERAVERTKASFLAEDPPPSVPSTASNPPVVERTSKPATQSPTEAPKEKSEVQSLWKTTGSRPSTTFRSNMGKSLPMPWEDGDTSTIKLEKVRALLGNCERCGLSAGRTKVVFGVGNPSARLMFIGESPDFNEDKEGEPFLGKAGELLDKMIVAMGLKRSDVFISNVIKCRPPNNREPEDIETQTCSPFLRLQIEAISPEVIVSLGKVSTNTLTKSSDALIDVRGTWQSFEGIPLMPTFHPAHLLRNPSSKRETWSDLQQVMKKLDLT